MNQVAFTITDLLVIIAVTSLLVSVLFAGVTAAKRKSRLAVCTSNLQQINKAMLTFCAEHNQTLPTISSESAGSLWWFYKEQIKRYAGLTGESSKNDTLFACPDDRGYTDPVPFHLNGRFDFNSYVYNGVTLPGMPSIANLQLSEIKQPKRTLLVMEWTAHAPLSWHKSKTGRANTPFYCDAESVAGFVDGHVNLTKIYYDGYNAAYTQDPIVGYAYQYSAN